MHDCARPATDTERRGGVEWERLDLYRRLSLLAWPVGFAAVALVAMWLDPDPRGLGTHEQLGFPPCTTQALFHVPCPFCGMTTAFAYMAHGDPLASFLCQPAGALAFVAGAVGAVGALAFAATGRWPARLTPWLQSWVLWGAALAILVLAWVYKIGLQGFAAGLT